MRRFERRLRKPRVAVTDWNGAVHGKQVPVRVVLHDTESHDAAGIGDITGIFNFWRGQGEGYNVHFIVDKDGNVGQGAHARDLCWHVGGLNSGSVGIEQVGFASFTRLIWSRSRRKQLERVARLLAWLHVRYDIPLTVPTVVDANCRGILTHAMVSAVFAESQGHTDPGPNYPLSTVLWLARRYVRLGGWQADRTL